MSSGIVHRNSSVMLAVGFGLGGILFQDKNWYQYSIGAMIGIMISPDWDVDNGFIGDMYVRRFGHVAELCWDTFLYVYRKSIKHGSPISHWPILGTFSRIIYMYVILVLIPMLLASFIMATGIVLPSTLLEHLFIAIGYRYMLIGLIASDTIHYILDMITTNEKVL